MAGPGAVADAGPLGQALAGLQAECKRHGPPASAIFGHELGEGQKAFAAGDYLLAALCFGRAVRESPRQPVAGFCLGLALLGLERFDDATRALERSLLLHRSWQLQPIDLRKLFGPRWAALEPALESWGRGAANRQAAQFLAVLARRYSGRFDEARKARDAFASSWPRAVTRRLALDRLFEPQDEAGSGDAGHRDPYVRGVYQFYNARYAEAADAFAEAYVQQPAFLLGGLFLGHAQFAAGKHELAARIVLRGVRRDPEQVARKIGLLREFYKDPDLLDRQTAALKAALKARPSPEGFFLLAYVYYADGEYPAAQALFGKLAETLGERQGGGLRALADQMKQWCGRQIRGEMPRREPVAVPPEPGPPPAKKIEPPAKQPAPQQQAGDPEDLLERCALHLKKGEYDAAGERIEAYFKAHKATALAYFLRARVHLARGEHVFGGIAVRNGLALAGDAAGVRFDWTRFYPSRKAFDEHLARLDHYVDAEPEKPNARFLAGFIHYHLGGYERALKLFKRNLWLDPNDRHARTYIDLITRQLSKDDDKE